MEGEIGAPVLPFNSVTSFWKQFAVQTFPEMSMAISSHSLRRYNPARAR
jgi:hypothetical protein